MQAHERAMGKCLGTINFRPLPLEEEAFVDEEPIVTEPTVMLPAPQLHEICRRWPAKVCYASLITTNRKITQSAQSRPIKYARDLSKTQYAWKRYCSEVRGLCSADFWKFYLPMHTLSRHGT